MTKVCRNCGQNTVRIKSAGLCNACYKYSKRHNGEPRPRRLYSGEATMFCRNCKKSEVKANGLCMACYLYEHRTGRKRPRYFIERKCQNCGNPRLHGKGLCLACYRYKQRTGRPRPKRLHLRHCECGNVVSHVIDTPHGPIDVCEPCYQLEQSYTPNGNASSGNAFDARRMDYHA